MTNEHHQQHPDVDAGVRSLYRDLAVETTPDHLDRAVLQAARAETRPKYARARAWTRPLAWAATIVLTVAVVIEINRVPAPDGVPKRELAPTSADQPEVSPAAEAAPVVGADIEQPQSPAAVQKGMPLPDAPEASSAVPITLEETAAAGRQEATFEDSTTQSSREIAVDVKSQVGKLQQDSGAIAQPQAATLRSRALTAVPEDAACPEDARATPETWLDCIQELEAAGLSDAATEQRRLLQQAFPGFQSR